MSEHRVASKKELPQGNHLIVELEGREIGIINYDGEYFAYTNWCPHQNGPVCEGKLGSTSEATFDREHLQVQMEWSAEQNILCCPWHGWEFDVETGHCLSKEKVKLLSHRVEISDDDIVVHL